MTDQCSAGAVTVHSKFSDSNRYSSVHSMHSMHCEQYVAVHCRMTYKVYAFQFSLVQ